MARTSLRNDQKWLWNFKDKKQGLWPKINMLKGNHCILRIQGVQVRQKLGIILENKVVRKKNHKKWSPKFIFLNDFFLKKIPSIFVIEN